MTLSVKHEEVSPQLAEAYLAKSGGNRTLNQDYVLSLAVSMETGNWDPDASELVFDEDGILIDGHHRLSAVLAFDKTVRMLVKRGVSKRARNVIDTGRTRTVADLFTMFRPGTTYIRQRRAMLGVCVNLLLPSPPAIRTLDAYDQWMRKFKDGVDAVAEIVMPLQATPFAKGTVAGAFAFAHKTSNRKVENFLKRVVDGLGLSANEPALTLRNLLMSGHAFGRNVGADRMRLSKKVLSAIYAEIKEEPWSKAQASDRAVAYFRKSYDDKSTEKLVDMWTAPAVEHEH